MKQVLTGTLIVLAMVLVAAAFLRLSISAGRGGETNPLYSTHRFDPYGTAALYRVLQTRGIDVQTLDRPRLPETQTGVLLQVLGRPDDADGLFLDDEDVNPYALPPAHVLEWVARGNTLIQLTRTRTGVMTELGFSDASVDEPTDADIYFDEDAVEAYQRKGGAPDDQPGRVVEATWLDEDDADRWADVRLREPMRFTQDTPEGWDPVLMRGGEAYGGQIEHGQGRVILVGAPTPALNRELGELDHLPWLLALAGDGPVVFDEWAHGVGHTGTLIETLARFGLVPLLLQVPVWLLFYRWSTAGRAAAPEPSTRRARSSLEQIDTLGRLYDNAWNDSEKFTRAYAELLTRLGDGCRCDASEVVARLQARQDEPAKRALELIERAARMSRSVRPTCPRCGYNLSGSKGDRCPECGEVVPRRVRRLIRQQGTVAADRAVRDKGRWSDATMTRILNDAATTAQELSRA